MNLPDLEPVRQAIAAWLTTYAEPLLIGAGAVGALLVLVLIWRFLRTGEAHERLGLLAVLLATGFATEGMYEAARHKLHLVVPVAVVLCATFEVLAAWLGALARWLRRQDPTADVRTYMNWLWAITIASGLIACTASDNLTQFLLRLLVPSAAGVVWWINLVAGRPAVARQASAWIWTPQRIGVRLGLLRPGAADDLDEVFRQRAVDRMVRLAIRLDTGAPWLASRRALRLRRLSARVTPDVLDAVALRYRQGTDAERLILGAVTHAAIDVPAPPAVEAPRRPEPPVTHTLTRLVTHADAPTRRTREVVMRRPVSAPPADRDAAMAQALDAVLQRGASVRGAAKSADVPEATLRRHVDRARAEQADVPRTNGHEFASTH